MNYQDLKLSTKKHCIERIQHLCKAREPIPTGEKDRLPKLASYKAVLFDVYGTILITGTEPGLASDQSKEEACLAKAFEERGVVIANEEVLSEFIQALHQAIQESHSLQRSEGIDYPEVDILAIWKQVIEQMLQNGKIQWKSYREPLDDLAMLIVEYVTRVEEPSIMPHFEEAIQHLHQKGIPLGIVSNAQFYSILTLEALLPEDIWKVIFPANDLQFWSFEQKIAKPSPHFFQRAATHLSSEYNIQPNQCLFVGNDMLKDMYASSKAGFKTALFAADKRSLKHRKDDERCNNLEVDAVITDYQQFVQS